MAWCAIALGLLEGATSETVSVAVAAAPLLNVTDDGEIEQFAPGMITPPQLRATVLERFETGVIVIVDVPDWPACTNRGLELGETLKSGIVTVTNAPPLEAT